MNEIEGLIQKAAAIRAPHLAENIHDAWRVINGPADGAPAGLSADFYQDYLVVNARASVPTSVVERWCEALWSVFAPKGQLLKILHERVGESTSRPFRGVLPSGPVGIREGEVRLLCNLDADFATGLYLDLHDVRLWLGLHTRKQEVLNLFSYTCSFSVHAAMGGARRLTSVDASKRALHRGRENMRANGLDPNAHRWFADDVMTHLGRAAKRGDTYDWIIADPPAFGRAGKRRFELKRDLDGLLDQSLTLLSAGGRLMLCTHTAGFIREFLLEALHGSAAKIGRKLELVKTFGLPRWDHPVLADKPGDRGDYLQVLVVEAK
jgi:23S rRNA (cytosine1962-C5)-methyltransferase